MRINDTVRVCVLCSLSLAGAFAQTATARIVKATNAFLATLDDKQKQSVLFAYDDEQQRKRWSNFPISIVPRAGLAMKDLTAAQQSAVTALMSTTLSARGWRKCSKSWKATKSSRPPTMAEAAVGADAEARRRRDAAMVPLPDEATARREAEGRADRAGREAACCLARISITSLFSVRRPKRLRGCCSSADTTWH